MKRIGARTGDSFARISRHGSITMSAEFIRRASKEIADSEVVILSYSKKNNATDTTVCSLMVFSSR